MTTHPNDARETTVSETTTAQQLFNVLFDELCAAKDAHYSDNEKPYPDFGFTEAYCELATDVHRPRGTVRAGTTLRIVFVSNMGDFGVTTNLGKKGPYDWRVGPEDGLLLNCRRSR